MRGRPTKLTPEVRDAIVNAVSCGNYPEIAAESEGVDRTTFYRWMQRGATDESGDYRDFRDAVMRARAKAERKMVRIVRRAAIEDAQSAQWYLERSASDRWGRRDKVQVENAVRDELAQALAKLEAGLKPEEFERVLAVLSDDGAGEGTPARASDDEGRSVH